MSKCFLQAGWRGVLACVLLCGMLSAPAAAGAAEKPYVETRPKRGFHLFLRPKQKTPAAQWTHVQALNRAGKTRAAANQALALRIFWPYSPEAPEAQMLHARLLERHRHFQDAFDAYQHLVEHYTGRFEFNTVIESQMRIAKTLMEARRGKFLFLPGFTAPERAIPLFETIATNAPEWHGTAEAYYLAGTAYERTYEYDKAIDAYFTTLNRFPESEFAERAAYAQAQCHIKVSDDAPHDSRALATARAACLLCLQRHPDSAQRPVLEAELARLRVRQVQNAYELAHYYDRILRKPEAALIEYQSFVALYPEAEQVAAARLRIEQLKPPQEN